ncbi:hypothetical protein JX265_008024 [Neoarthrinium moseri]|uniref:SET domain-containing protein n=1 Tax=Neoarthrinium moseri TaxID=1658444 RepID=A0A9P9WJ22_9PEZI|nr:uncharacterized protein JN550_004529 [Neoarthrinium moseri]KAI1865701.1 hypothetical protein JX265_008024 [Neoarthrinium moseri]KAI1871535.1 hypothetical protein JN550_004529 [Neoarthrinium moseri]
MRPSQCLQVHGSSKYGNQSVNRDVPAGWAQGEICQTLGRERYCVFTLPEFSGGDGVSIITTRSRLSDLASKQPFQSGNPPANTHVQAGTSTIYRQAELPEKGIGLLATAPIRAGQRIMSRTPALIVDGRLMQGLERNRMSQLLAQAVQELPTPHRKRFLDLSTHSSVSTFADRVYQIFAVNNFRTSLNGWDFQSTFTEVSRLNHDCRPNSVYYFDPQTFSHKVMAVRNIVPGEELTISYIDGFQSRAARQDQLLRHWGFSCSCHVCQSDAHIAEESDSRVAQILELWKELDDYSPSSSATPEKAELLVELYGLEGMEGRIQEAYYRAAIEFNALGLSSQAMKYARLCLDKGLAFKGPGRPFIDSMKELLRDAEAHHSWKSRIRAPI